MKKTVGNIDRVLRAVLAIAALIAAGVAGFSSGWGIIFIVVAAILAATGSSGYCPIYSVTGLNTLAKDTDATHQRHASHGH
jgi:hypothetical protein